MIEIDRYPPGGPGLPAAVVAELRVMLGTAAAADAEAGFPQVSLDDTGPSATQLLVRLRPDERAGRAGSLAAYLRVEPATGEVGYVVAPDVRSRGITTLLVEEIGLDVAAAGGWLGTGVHAPHIWARGDHPAAQRLARRFRHRGIRAVARRWELLLPRDGGLPPDVLTVDADDLARVQAARALGYRHDRTDVRYAVGAP